MQISTRVASATALLISIGAIHQSGAATWAPPSFDDARPAIEALWSKTRWAKETKECRGRQSVKWHFEVTPVPFPETWPPYENSRVVYYVRAKEICPASILGGDFTGPWARIVYSRDGTGTVQVLPVQELQAHGLGHRLRTDEVPILDSRNIAMGFIASLTATPSDAESLVPVTKRFYCWAIPRWGLFIGQEPNNYHPEFMEWLACGSQATDQPGR